MDLGLASRRAFIGGASRGLGYAVAEALVREGAQVAIAARDERALAAARDALVKLGPGPVVAITGDLGHADSAAHSVARAIEALGGLDVLVTNSGGPAHGGFTAHDDAAWRSAAELLLFSTVAMVRAALPALEKSDQARIVHVASTSIKQPIDALLLSNSLRAAVAGLAKSLSLELGPKGVLVNVVCPGSMDTDRIRDLDEAQAHARGVPREQVTAERAKSIPLGRIGRPEELGAAIAFLCSARASYITGAVLQVDGGATKFLL
jgi:3-oxoacyl-[acyl-carrier protein] reductase